MSQPLPTREDVISAAERIEPYLDPTPLVESRALGALLKVETVQPTGSFKVRGAFSALTAAEEGARVVTASAGNHGLGVAYAAETLDVQATVVCATTASPVKLAMLRGLPVDLVVEGQLYDDAERVALELAQGDARYVSAYNDALVIAGQATVAVELLEELSGPLTILVPAGGGGLLSGVSLWASERPEVRVIGVETDASPALRAALDAGRIVPIEVGPSIADGLAGNLETGSITYELVHRHADDVVVVSESEVEEAIRRLWHEHGLVVEGAGAAAVAAHLAGVGAGPGPTVCLLTGRNIAEDAFSRIVGQDPGPGPQQPLIV